MTPGQTTLTYQRSVANKTQDVYRPPPSKDPNANVDPTIHLLAGVVKFNTCLTSLTLANGLNNKGGACLAVALHENKTLEHLDISGEHSIDPTGIEEVAKAVRTHKRLEAFKVDGTQLPVIQLRGAHDNDADRLHLASLELRRLSGHAMGIILRSNAQLNHLLLNNNSIGAEGIKAVVCGLGEAPLKILDIARTGPLGADTEDAQLKELSASICQHAGLLSELRMDENELSCDESALAPLCKLRNLRTLSLEKNRLVRQPPLIGTLVCPSLTLVLTLAFSHTHTLSSRCGYPR